ncbi:MAG: hypothetical protein V7L23_17815 [Nostoc sp.]
MPNYQELYAGKVDLVARYQGVPHLIEWTTAEEPKLRIDKLYDKPLQLAAYGGAINRYYSDHLFNCKINHALIVVALPGEEAEIFEFDRKFGIQAPSFYDGFIFSWISISINVLSLSCQPGMVINCSLIPGLSLRQIGSLASGLSLIKPSLCFFWNVIVTAALLIGILIE